MSNFKTTPENELKEIKYQLARLAYDQFCFTSQVNGVEKEGNFRDLGEGLKSAWIEGVWAAIEASKTKKITFDKRTKKEMDVGYLLFAGAKEIAKNNPGIYTYSKFPERVKEKYRELALKVYYAVDFDEEVSNNET